MAETDPTATPSKPDADDAKKLRDKVAALLARPPTLGEGSVTVDGVRLDYSVKAAFVPVGATGLGADCGDPRAAVFTIAYSVKPEGAAPRPVCFAFNGGPGSASVWLHFGALGPKRVPIHDDGSMPRAPYTLVDNPLTWLAHFDLVFVDPPHTGFSLCASEVARKAMLSVDGDVEALAEVVRAWLAANGRFGAPLYLAGESYGTTRCAALADKLLAMGLALDGLILVSCAMDLQALVFAPRNDLPYALFLPAFANAAQYHGLLSGALAESPAAARAAAEAFVAEDYLPALHAGARLGGDARRSVERRLAELTGLPLALVEEKNLRIDDQTFFFEALRPRGRIVGRLEARCTGPMAARRTRDWEFDPGMDALNAPYTTTALAYYASLGIPIDARYEVLNLDVHKSWRWQRGAQKDGDEAMGYACTSTDLSRALRRHPHLRVLAASGRYDLGTPYSATDWSLAQLDAPADVLARVTHRHYDAGHMFYTRSADLKQLKDDLAAWLETRA
jgi:carboxypeptidase C (cathepsin A)